MLAELLIGALSSALLEGGKVGLTKLLSKPPLAKAISATAAQFPNVPPVSDALKAWSQSDDFFNIIDAIRNDRDSYSDERIIDSFVQIGQFSDGITKTFATAERVLEAFAKNLEKEMYRSEDGLLLEGRRAKLRHEEIRQDLRGLARELRDDIRSGGLLSTAANSRELLPNVNLPDEFSAAETSPQLASSLPDALITSGPGPQDSPPPSKYVAVPFQNTAPLPINDYVGRATLLQELTEANIYRFVVIVGLLGVGKSTLLGEVAHRFGSEAVFWYSFRSGLVSLEDLIRRLARFIDSRATNTSDLAREIESLSSIQDKIDLLVEELNHGSYRLIFDRVNLCEEEPAVESFLDVLRERLQAGTIFVADRSKPSFITPIDETNETVRVITLQGLTAPEIEEFMSRKGVRISGSTAKALATDLDGIPLALELLIALAGDNPSNEVLLDHANNAKEGMVESLFNEVYRRLEKDEMEVLTIASVFSLPFFEDQLLAVHKTLNKSNGKAAFDSLRRKSLVKDLGDGFYQLHEVVSLLALTYLEADFNTLRLKVAEELTQQMPDVMTVHLEAALLYIKAHEFDKAADLATSMVAREFLLYHPNLTETLVEAFREEDVSSERWIWLLGDKGRIAEFWHRYDEATTYYQDMLKLANAGKDKLAQAIALQRLGNIDLGTDDDSAEQYYSESMSLKVEIGDLDGQAEIHNNLGIIYSDRGEFDRARDEYERGLTLREEIGSEDWKKLPLITNLGILYARQHNWEKAREYSERALRISEDLGSPYHIAKATYNLAKHDMVEGNTAAAKEKLLAVLSMVEGLELWEIEDLAYTALGLTHYNENDFDQAISSFLKLAEIRERFDNESQLAPIYFDLGTFNLKRGDVASAFSFYLKGVSLFGHILNEYAIDRYAHNIYVLATKLENQDLVELLRALRELRRRLPTGYAKSRIYDTFGYIYSSRLENNRAAFTAWKCQIEMFHATNRFREEAEALIDLGAEFQKSGQPAHAIKLNEQALTVSNTHEFNDLIGTINFNMGNCFAQIEMLPQAQERYESALSNAIDNGNADLERMVAHNLGEVLREQGKLEQACELLERTVRAYREAEDFEGVIHALNNIGLAYAELNREADAISSFNEAAAIAREHSLFRDLSNTLISIGNFYLESDALQAKAAYEESLEAARNARNVDQEEKAMLSLAFAHRELGTFNTIEKDFEIVLKQANELNHNENLLKMLTFAAEINFDEKETDASAEMFEKALLFSLIVSAKTFKDLAAIPPGPLQVRTLTYVLAHLLRVIDGALNNNEEDLALHLYTRIREKITAAEHWPEDTFINQFLDVVGDYLTHKPDEELIDYVTKGWAKVHVQ